ncbi:aryl-alcohol dehydrogenase-like predicted oxidoreductase [Brevibacterium sanguinis]|uniref:Aryl-alcohol dehydrogenase-like predicted oxidoreductase n=2 Tax=Brevibacterium TaxID=1696 RepID=A0A366IL29_9MICO|nr:MULTISPECIES: aldo/keto reductase [Brevibacterium]RBP64683.1 aryl-alcohol dehydrogenase-like predicted oxidoreductase [Brevibacterium sanguinis]RBP71674.1 aryl-alcohol dehydrogenase-like predicted oxidoreductase [Brevibacterium celere]
MKHQRLGTTGLDVSDLGLGTFEWGHRVDVGAAQRILDVFIDAGGNLVELPSSGVQAAAVLSRLSVPAEIVLCARVGVSMSETSHIEVGLGRSRILDQVDRLLSATGREHIDVLVLDVFDEVVDKEETASALSTLLTLGKIRYIGLSHHTGWQLSEMRHMSVPVAAVLAEYSLLNREAEHDLIPAADYAGIGFIAGAGLGRGVLSDKYVRSTPGDSRAAGELAEYVGAYLDDRCSRVMAGVRRAATALGVSSADIALAFNRHRGVTSSLVSARTEEQMAALARSDVALAPEIAEVLEQIS